MLGANSSTLCLHLSYRALKYPSGEPAADRPAGRDVGSLFRPAGRLAAQPPPRRVFQSLVTNADGNCLPPLNPPQAGGSLNSCRRRGEKRRCPIRLTLCSASCCGAILCRFSAARPSRSRLLTACRTPKPSFGTMSFLSGTRGTGGRRRRSRSGAPCVRYFPCRWARAGSAAWMNRRRGGGARGITERCENTPANDDR